MYHRIGRYYIEPKSTMDGVRYSRFIYNHIWYQIYKCPPMEHEVEEDD